MSPNSVSSPKIKISCIPVTMGVVVFVLLFLLFFITVSRIARSSNSPSPSLPFIHGHSLLQILETRSIAVHLHNHSISALTLGILVFRGGRGCAGSDAIAGIVEVGLGSVADGREGNDGLDTTVWG